MLLVLIASTLPPGPVTRSGPIWHLLGYAVLGALFMQWQVIPIAALLAWGYGAVIEVVQAFLPYRSAELGDVAMNAVGVLAGVAAVQLVRRIRRPR